MGIVDRMDKHHCDHCLECCDWLDSSCSLEFGSMVLVGVRLWIQQNVVYRYGNESPYVAFFAKSRIVQNDVLVVDATIP